MKKKLGDYFLSLFRRIPTETSITELTKGGKIPISSIKKGKFLNITATDHPLGYYIERILPSGTKVSYIISPDKVERIEKLVIPNTGKIAKGRINYSGNKKLLSHITDASGNIYTNTMLRTGWAKQSPFL